MNRNSLAPGTPIDHFRVEGVLGEGAMSTVYLATDTRLDRSVALKFASAEVELSEEGYERFSREAHTVARLSHPSIASLFDIGRQDGRPYIVFEYVEGASLKELLEEGPLSTEDAGRLLEDIGRGLDHAHERQILHRDVKPANIMRASDGRFVLLDFGLSQFEGISDLTQPGTFLGSPLYMSPEHLRGEQLTAASGWWGLGAVLYEALTGRVPFEARDVGELIGKVTGSAPEESQRFEDPRREELRGIALGLLSKDPKDRPVSVEASDPERFGRTGLEGRPRRWRLVPPALVGIGLLVWTVMFFLGEGSDSSGPVTLQIGEVRLAGWPESREIAENALREAIRVRLMEHEGIELLASGADTGSRPRAQATLSVKSMVHDGGLRTVLEAADPRSGISSWSSEIRQGRIDLNDLVFRVSDRISREYSATGPVYPLPRDLTKSPPLSDLPGISTVDSLYDGSRDCQVSEIMREIARAHPTLIQAWAVYAYTVLDCWDAVRADDHLEELHLSLDHLQALDEDSPYVQTILSYLEYTSGDLWSAERRLDELLQRYDLTPALRASIHRMLSLIDVARSDFEEAEDALVVAVDLDPVAAQNWDYLSRLNRRMGRAGLAVVQARKAVSLDPVFWRRHQRLGMALFSVGNYEGAIDAFRRALDLGGNQETSALLAAVLEEGGYRVDARKQVRAALQLPSSPWGLYNVSCYWARAGQVDSAMVYLEKAVEIGLSTTWIFEDPDLQSLHGLDRFERLRGIVEARIDASEQ